MNFNKHVNLEGQHAFLGASSYHWLNYSKEKLIDVYKNRLATLKGTELHDAACRFIKLGIKVKDSNHTFGMYVNDAINFSLKPEVLLYFSPYCFGTADAIGFDGKVLRVHDLKTGSTPAHMEQLYIYVALFCLEYHMKPSDFEMIETRIYQDNNILIDNPTSEVIVPIMDKCIMFSKMLAKIDEEEEDK